MLHLQNQTKYIMEIINFRILHKNASYLGSVQLAEYICISIKNTKRSSKKNRIASIICECKM
jgi:hypothetical protein